MKPGVIVGGVCLWLASAGLVAGGLGLSWTNNYLTISGDKIPGGQIETLYLEAFCRSGSTRRDWHETVIPHRTELVKAAPDGRALTLRSEIAGAVEVMHELEAREDEVVFRLTVVNRGKERADVQWFQPCMRVGSFTGGDSDSYLGRCFIMTERGWTWLGHLPRATEALYRGGQVYVPGGVPAADVNPRPVSAVRPVAGVIGCVSADGKWILATAWDRPQELFQGVIRCIHCDPRIGGLGPGERKQLLGRVYVVPNDPGGFMERYRRDFGEGEGRLK